VLDYEWNTSREGKEEWWKKMRGEQKGKRNRGEMVVHEKNLYMGEWDEVTKKSKGNGLERSRRSIEVMEQ
jgi:hypothetical protein